MRLAAILTILLLVIAGCLRGDGGGQERAITEEDVIQTATPYLSQGHGEGSTTDLHRDATLHNGSHGIERVGYHNGVDESGDPDAIASGVRYTEIALHDRYVYLARVAAAQAVGPEGVADQTGGFTIIDANNPAAPTFVGQWQGPNGFDLEISSDGALAFFATQRNSIEELAGNLQAHEDDTTPLPRGIHIVDVSLPSSPETLSFYPMPNNGPHTVAYYDEGDREFLFAQTYDLAGTLVPSTTGGAAGGALTTVYDGALPATQRVTVLEIIRDHSSGEMQVSLTPIAQFQINEVPDEGDLYIPHDVSIQHHPLRDRTYLYVAYWDLGVRIVDISELPEVGPEAGEDDLPMLEEVGSYQDFSPSALRAMHLAKPFDELIGNRHITVAEPEVVTADETGQITFIDTSDPNLPTRACETSYWELPVELVTTEFDFSPHNFDVFGDRVALAHNHAGVWILDAGDLCDPQAAGFYMDTFQRTDSPQLQPWFWGVFEQDGLLYAVDEATGLYILRPQ